MQLNDVASLVKLLDKSSLTEISFSDETSKVVLKKEVFRAAPMQPAMMPMAVARPLPRRKPWPRPPTRPPARPAPVRKKPAPNSRKSPRPWWGPSTPVPPRLRGAHPGGHRRQGRPGPLHHRSHENHERDRVRPLGRGGRSLRTERNAGGIRDRAVPYQARSITVPEAR